MAKERLLIVILATLARMPSPADAQAIRGAVIDAGTRAPVASAELEVMTRGQGEAVRAVTDSLGRFAIVLARGDAYRLRVSHLSYVTYQLDSIQVGTGEVVTLEVRLGQAAIPLEPVIVTGRRVVRMEGFDERRRAGFGRFLTRDEIDVYAATRTTNLLQNFQGLRIRPIGRSGSMVLMSGAAGLCQPAIWLDGVQVRQYAGSTLDDILTPASIEAVEVYTSYASAPTQYISGQCGVILFWTRRGSNLEGSPWQWKKVLAGAGAAILVILLIR